VRAVVLAALLSCSACALTERNDFLVGRPCEPNTPSSCDVGEKCLPHAISNGSLTDFMCRDRASFDPISSSDSLNGRDPPLAYCDGMTYLCPDGLVCAADKVRDLNSGGFRPLVCRTPMAGPDASLEAG
jgi:hypothetical protein